MPGVDYVTLFTRALDKAGLMNGPGWADDPSARRDPFGRDLADLAKEIGVPAKRAPIPA